MSFELELIKETLENEIEKAKRYHTTYTTGRINGMEYALGLVDIALEGKEVEHGDS